MNPSLKTSRLDSDQIILIIKEKPLLRIQDNASEIFLRWLISVNKSRIDYHKDKEHCN